MFCVYVCLDFDIPAWISWYVLHTFCDAHAQDAACFAGRGVESLDVVVVCVRLDLLIPAWSRR